MLYGRNRGAYGGSFCTAIHIGLDHADKMVAFMGSDIHVFSLLCTTLRARS